MPTLAIVLGLMLWGQLGSAQSPNPSSKLEFEVATVRAAKPDEPGGGIRPLPGGQTYTAKNVPVALMIRLMFHLTPNQISGGPGWINTDRWDVDAKAEHPASLDDLHIMFQNLLIERFNIKFHHETKELSVYALVCDKGGSKMQPNTGPDPYDIPIQGAGRGKLVGKRVPMSYLTWFLAGLPWIGRPVLDKTGLTGFYDFNFEFMPPQVIAPGSPETDVGPGAEGPSFFTAVREQLGLRLEPEKGPVEIMVIDSIQKPTEN
ncbi:MAG TPA: TIGR03435 family protein [Bryobacteraceae bacterium]|nr:TIGR03435 family protein [Bryobacteraceae bacterium]